MKKTVLLIALLVVFGCYVPSITYKEVEEIHPSKDVVKSIEYKVPPGARFNVPVLLKMNIKDFDVILGKSVEAWEPNEYQRAIGMNMISNKVWKIESTKIDVEYNDYGKIVSIFLMDNEYNLSAGSMMVRGNINPEPEVKDYSVRYQKWVNSEYANKLKASQIAGIEVKPK